MKRVIDGFRYDTEKAQEMLRVSEGNAGDFSACEYGIFRTPRGHWFIAGSGGPMTRFAQPVSGNSWQGGEKIIPLAPVALLDLIETIQDRFDCDSLFDCPELQELITED